MRKLSGKIALFEVIVLILTACLGIRWIPVAGSIGPSAILFWIIGTLLFFGPLSLIVMELSNNYTKDGGVYLWVKNSLGNQFGFYTAWLYWINNFFFYPGLLIFMVANLAYLFGDKHLAENHIFVITTVIISLWVAIFINIKGVKSIAKIAAFACALNVSLGIFIIVSGLLYVLIYHHSETLFSFKNFLPDTTLLKNLSNLTLLMFALSGIELIPAMAGSIENSRRTLKYGIIISAIIILLTYILGTMAINVILSPAELNNTTGLMETFLAISAKLHLTWISYLFIILLFLIEFGALTVWLIAPTIIFFESVEKGIIPAWMQKLNQHHVPANALIFIGCIVTLIIILLQYLPTINSIFTALVLMGTIVYFLPYLFLVAGFLKLKRANQLAKPLLTLRVSYVLGFLLFFAVFLGLILSFVPSADIHSQKSLLLYEIELAGGPFFFIALGFLIYHLHQRRG